MAQFVQRRFGEVIFIQRSGFMRWIIVYALLAPMAASQAIAQMDVSVPLQYQGRWAENCDIGNSITVTDSTVGGFDVKGVIEFLPGHKIILAQGTEVTFFPQIGANGKIAMVSFKVPDDKEGEGKIMQLCRPAPSPLWDDD